METRATAGKLALIGKLYPTSFIGEPTATP